MEGNPHPIRSRSVTGGLIHLQARLTNIRSWLGPAWAASCGIIASGSYRWQGEDWLRAALLILLIDAGWGTLWAALAGTDWATPLRRWRHWAFGEQVRRPPYTLAGSPGDAVLRWVGQLRTWWRDLFWITCKPAASTILIAFPVTLVLGALLGRELLLLSAAALAAMQLGVIWTGGRGESPPLWSAVVGVTLPWMAGHIAFEALTLDSAALAVALALAWGTAWRADSAQGRAINVASQFMATGILVARHQPVAACCLALLLVPQALLLSWMRRGRPAAWYVHHSRPWLMGAMLVAAWAL